MQNSTRVVVGSCISHVFMIQIRETMTDVVSCLMSELSGAHFPGKSARYVAEVEVLLDFTRPQKIIFITKVHVICKIVSQPLIYFHRKLSEILSIKALTILCDSYLG